MRIVAVLCGIFVPVPAHADVGIPMISCIHPGLWLALPAVILVEWAVAAFVVRWRVRIALKVAFICNIASTLLGIPMKWLLVWSLTPMASAFLSAIEHSPDHVRTWSHGTPFQRLAIAIIERPDLGGWGPPDSYVTRVWLYWALLLIPFFLLSVWVEWRLAIWLVGGKERRRAASWAWIANGLSYSLLAGLFWVLYANTWWWISRP